MKKYTPLRVDTVSHRRQYRPYLSLTALTTQSNFPSPTQSSRGLMVISQSHISGQSKPYGRIELQIGLIRLNPIKIQSPSSALALECLSREEWMRYTGLSSKVPNGREDTTHIHRPPAYDSEEAGEFEYFGHLEAYGFDTKIDSSNAIN